MTFIVTPGFRDTEGLNWRPSVAELAEIITGTEIKVCHSGERFWATVLHVSGDNIDAEVSCELSMGQPFNLGDIIYVRKHDVYQIDL